MQFENIYFFLKFYKWKRYFSSFYFVVIFWTVVLTIFMNSVNYSQRTSLSQNIHIPQDIYVFTSLCLLIATYFYIINKNKNKLISVDIEMLLDEFKIKRENIPLLIDVLSEIEKRNLILGLEKIGALFWTIALTLITIISVPQVNAYAPYVVTFFIFSLILIVIPLVSRFDFFYIGLLFPTPNSLAAYLLKQDLISYSIFGTNKVLWGEKTKFDIKGKFNSLIEWFAVTFKMLISQEYEDLRSKEIIRISKEIPDHIKKAKEIFIASNSSKHSSKENSSDIAKDQQKINKPTEK